MRLPIDSIIEAVVARIKGSGLLESNTRMGVVASVGTDGTATVTCGTDTFTKVRLLSGYLAANVGDVVTIIKARGGWVCAGSHLTAAPAPVVTVIPWTTASLASGFAHNGNGNGNVSYRVISQSGAKFVQWRGGLGVTYTGSGTPPSSIQNGGNFLASALPSTAWPVDTRKSVIGVCSAQNSSQLALKIDFANTGASQIVGTGTGVAPPWISLNGISYCIDA